MNTLDLNSDLGEGAGCDEEILELVSSASIACGLHAGEPRSIFASILLAQKHGVAVGAHPSFNDRANFGRTEMQIGSADVFALATYQIGAFAALCEAAGVEMNHVKPHGALYNMAARDRALADAITHAMLVVDASAILFAPTDSTLAQAAHAQKIRCAREVFADRNYLPDGALMPRERPDALLHDTGEAAQRIVRMLREGRMRAIDGSDIPLIADTICVHGDTPGAVKFVRELRGALEDNGVTIAAPSKH
ncbi:MAG: LamB/YcsF family protein [Verrucomicrobiota bacterium]|nr:LamB/YcsF family protein [Verrucomicrobiota bacterium]